MNTDRHPLAVLRHHVTGAIERGEKQAIAGVETTDRHARLMPGGIPRYVRCYDNSGKSFDRYTVIFTRHPYTFFRNGSREALAMSAEPLHPQGFGQHVQVLDGKHLGKRIKFTDLPPDCRTLVIRDYKQIWGLT